VHDCALLHFGGVRQGLLFSLFCLVRALSRRVPNAHNQDIIRFDGTARKSP
jgi:hypothetical protein